MDQTYLTCDRASSGGDRWAQLSLRLYPHATGPEALAGPGCVSVRPSAERPPHARALLGGAWAHEAVGPVYVLRARWAWPLLCGRACRTVRRTRCSLSPLRCAGGAA
jgi:hypothetical protein